MEDFRNSNGLVEGKIPVGDPCPFFDKCGHSGLNCPTQENPKTVPFSCGLARGWSISKESKR